MNLLGRSNYFMDIFASILWDGGWNPSCCWMFWKTYIFLSKKLNAKRLSEILAPFVLQSVLLSLWLLFPVFTPFYFLCIWNKVLNDWNSYLLCSGHYFKYFINLSAKVDIEFISWCSILIDCALLLLLQMD